MNNNDNMNPTPQTNNVEPPVTPQVQQPVQSPVQGPVQSQTSSVQVPQANNEVSEIQNVPTGVEEVTVVNTERKKTSSIIMIILVAILIAFVFNIDKVIEYYDNYMATGSLTSKNNNENTNNLVNGYILIGDNTSKVEVEKIVFYNFRKKEDDSSIIFNYESGAKYSDSTSLKIYIEFYNSDKAIIYKELFDTKNEIEKDTVRTHSVAVTADVLQDARYALAKKYSDSELNSTQALTCKYNNVAGESTLNYTIIYNFKNNGLINYVVNKQITNYEENSLNYKSLENEYNNVSQKINATFQNGTLNYTVNLESDIGDLTPLYAKGTIIATIKNKEKLKEWVCE